MPNTYFLSQSHQGQQAGGPENEQSRDWECYHSPQEEMGSMTDTRKHTEPNVQGIGSEEALKSSGTTGANINKGTMS